MGYAWPLKNQAGPGRPGQCADSHELTSHQALIRRRPGSTRRRESTDVNLLHTREINLLALEPFLTNPLPAVSASHSPPTDPETQVGTARSPSCSGGCKSKFANEPRYIHLFSVDCVVSYLVCLGWDVSRYGTFIFLVSPLYRPLSRSTAPGHQGRGFDLTGEVPTVDNGSIARRVAAEWLS